MIGSKAVSGMITLTVAGQSQVKYAVLYIMFIIIVITGVVQIRYVIPSVTARVKISQNFDILANVYLVYLKDKHCQTLHVVSTFTGQNESTVF